MTALPVLVLAGATLLASIGGLLADVLWEATLGLAMLPALFLGATIGLQLAFVASDDEDAAGQSVWGASPGEHWLVVVAVVISIAAAALLVTGLTRGRRGPHLAGCLFAVIAAIVQAVTVVAIAAD